jgi:hypothetical protein
MGHTKWGKADCISRGVRPPSWYPLPSVSFLPAMASSVPRHQGQKTYLYSTLRVAALGMQPIYSTEPYGYMRRSQARVNAERE